MSVPPASHVPGPAALGRGVVVMAGAGAPAPWADAPRLRIDDEVVDAPAAAAALLYDRWVRRQPVVVELATANDRIREPEVVTSPPWELPPDLSLDRERLHFLIWANTYDARHGDPIWWHGVLAERRGARRSDRADVCVDGPDGPVDAWVDGGPRGPVAGLTIVHRESVGLGRPALGGHAAPDADLAPDQLDAVAHTAGPARVIAPAGSGKTRVLTARIRHLLRDRRVEPELVTAVAYNTRAAEEMRARLADDPVTRRATVRTIHSLALWICNLTDRRRVIEEREVRAVLSELVRVPRIPNQDPIQPYLEALSEIRLALRPPEEVEASRDDVDGLAAPFAGYREVLTRDRLLDFDEQITRAIEVLLTRPEIRREVQRRCTHLLVDEFQDLTPAFLLLLRLAAGPSAQVFAVGDDDQVIYSHAGATPDYLVGFDRLFPGAGHHALEVNYRCPAPVVAAASTLLTHNRVRVPKTIRPADGAPSEDGAAPDIHRVDAVAMAERTVALVRDWLDAGIPPAQVAVLARVNSALLPVQVALQDAGLPTTAPLDATTLGRTGIRTALAYLRIGLDPERIRRDDLFETLRRPSRKLVGAVTPLLRRSTRWSIAQLEALADLLEGRYRDRLDEYLADLRLVAAAITDGADTAACLGLIRERIGLGEAMASLDSSRTRPEGSSHGDDLDALEQLAALHPDPATFREWLVDQLRRPGDPDGVVLSTVHRVKGMEWERVVVFAANAGLMPHRLADDVEEERRVMHVALTRCRHRVAIVANRAAASPFLDDLHRPADTPPRAARDLDVEARPARVVDGHVVAERGVVLELPGGLPATIEDVDGGRITARLDGGIPVALAVGAPVRVEGSSMPLALPQAAPAAAPAPAPPVDEALFDALRRWRSRVASEKGLPAYVILHDQHLRAIAAARPRSLTELSACPGIGPTKLDRYGDDLLAIVDDGA